MIVIEAWEKHEDEYLEFDKIENKLSTAPDIHAFILLNNLFPGTSAMVIAVEHDEIWLGISSDDIEKLSDEHILELTRCGVSYSEGNDSLCMFV